MGKEKRARTKQVNLDDLKLPKWRMWILLHPDVAVRLHPLCKPIYWTIATVKVLRAIGPTARAFYENNHAALEAIALTVTKRPKVVIEGKDVSS